MKQVKAIIKPYKIPNVIKALNDHANFPDVVISSVVVFGSPGEMNSNIKIFHEYFGYAKKVNLK